MKMMGTGLAKWTLRCSQLDSLKNGAKLDLGENLPSFKNQTPYFPVG